MESKFPGLVLPDELDMRALGGSPTYKMKDGKPYPYNYYLNLTEFRVIWDTGIIYVPANFIYDRASVPRFAQDIGIYKDGPWQRGSLPHDWVFVNKGVPGCETFDLANDLLYECMLIEDAHEFYRDLVMLAVRSSFGQAAWDDDK